MWKPLKAYFFSIFGERKSAWDTSSVDPDDLASAAERKPQTPSREFTGKPCDRCGRPIPPYVYMGGSGFQSETYHERPTLVCGRRAMEAVRQELCHACYRQDYFFVHSKEAPAIANCEGFPY
jgi:hypothetical protein